MDLKRSYEEAFKRKTPLHTIEIDDFLVEHTIYKVINKCGSFSHDIKTSENRNFSYGDSVIKETATSATVYTSERKATKTYLIELFSSLSLNDIWFATFFKQNTDNNWQDELVTKIQSMEKDNAVKFVKKDFNTFGKSLRELVGQKITLKSDNNYYMVRDLKLHFDELNTKNLKEAAKKSIRNLDVNTLQSLIFNGVKYILK